MSVTIAFECAPHVAQNLAFALAALFAGLAAWGGARLFARLDPDPGTDDGGNDR